MRNILICIICVFVCLSIELPAEGVVGNGGSTIVCKDTNNPNHQALVDLYELDKLYGYSLNRELVVGSSRHEIINRLILKAMPLNPNYAQAISTYMNKFHTDSVIIDAKFSFSNDVFDGIYPQECEIETMVYQKSTWPYYIISARWHSLNEYQRAALMLHEVNYRISLSYNPNLKSSKKVRKLVAYFFSNEFQQTKTSDEFNNLINGLISNAGN